LPAIYYIVYQLLYIANMRLANMRPSCKTRMFMLILNQKNRIPNEI